MIIPIRCFTCNRILASKYKKYLELTANNNEEQIMKGDGTHTDSSVFIEVFKKIGLDDRYCCKRHMISHIDLTDKI
jgi:DNA-directed RNA polymerase subunit N